ncbi:MAG: hypothetical protein LBQ77_05780 [Treponema sp.]|jgi:hypothetical protein|nr:hypothetical protein [Treponema sp.]
MNKKSLYLGFVTLFVAMSVVFTACKDDEEKPAEETFTDVKSVYSLSTNNTLNPANLTIESARKDKETGVTTIVLSGTIASGIPTGLVADFLGDASFATGTGVPTKYSAFVIKGLTLGAGVNIKQTNNSFILYKEFPDKGQAVETNGTYVKDKTYTTDPNELDGGFDILFADGVTPETATLEITPAGGTKYTVIIDWSKVTFS